MEEQEKKKYIRMTTAPVERLVCRLAVPTIISMLVSGLYNVVDTFFVGRISNEATAGVGLVLPVMAIIQAFGFFFGQGSGNYISRSLGAMEIKRAEIMAATGSICAVLFGLIITGLGLIFRPAVLYVLGAREGVLDELTIRYTSEYLSIILCGAAFMSLSCVLNNQLRFQGNAFFSMIGLVSGAVLNCVLDPIFIFALGMGIKGAAFATVMGQAASCILLYIGTLRSDNLKIHLRNFSPTPYYLVNICKGGLPSLFRQGFNSLSSMCLNFAAAAAASAALATQTVAAFTIVNKISMLAFSAVIGFGQGFQPICGFNYGAQRYDRVRKAYVFCIRLSFIFLIVMDIMGFIFAGSIVAIFRDDAQVIAIGKIIMRCQCCGFWLTGIVTMTNMIYQNIGRTGWASLISISRQGLFFIPAVLILPQLMRVPIWGVYISQPVSDICAFLIAFPLAIKIYRELKTREAEQICAEGKPI